ncbi:hypothetical protein OSJ20_25600, partial [Mycobacterium ulcerans]
RNHLTENAAYTVNQTDPGQDNTAPSEWMCSLDTFHPVPRLLGLPYRIEGWGDRRVYHIT